MCSRDKTMEFHCSTRRRRSVAQLPLVLGSVLVLSLLVRFAEGQYNERISIGSIFDEDYTEINGAFRHAMEQYHHQNSTELQVFVDIISTRDAYKIAKLICKQFSKGIWAMVACVKPDSFDTLHSYANTFKMPFVTPWFPENVARSSSIDYGLSMMPDYHQAIIDIIHYYRWDHIVYLYDSHEGLLRLQDIFQEMKPPFRIRDARKIRDAGDALQFLKTLERGDRFSLKYIVIDCNTATAKSLIRMHVNDTQMGRRNYHYLLSGLVFDDEWEVGISEYGAINITGFRIVDTSKPFVQNFLRRWRLLDRNMYSGVGETISARAALMYDSVKVVTESIAYIQRSSEGKGGPKRGAFCDLNSPNVTFWSKGWGIANFMRQVVVEGLTGNISFSQKGRRQGYSMDVVEMDHDSQLVKIGSWSDVSGFRLTSSPSMPQNNVRYRNRNIASGGYGRAYVVTSIMEKPFLMRRTDANYEGNERYEGYCKDLADLLARRLNITYVLKEVHDNTYGSANHTGQWNGMVGELLTGAADIAIAPLTITASREGVIDFTKPFMTQGISIMIKRPMKQDPGVFSFMAPLSKEIWMSNFFAYLAVSIVLFLVSRFSPYEWRIVEDQNKKIVKNDFNICNSLWFTFGAVMQQGIDMCPRSLSGRIVGSVWWFFTLILISSYTANLAAFLTVERMITPIKSADDLSKQTEVEYGLRRGGSTMEFFQRSTIPVYQKMWEFMDARKTVFTDTYQEGIDKVRNSKGKYAFLLESVKNDFTNEQLPCDTIKIGQDLNTNGYGVATPIGSPIKERLNLGILELIENGDLAKLKNKWWFERSKCTNTQQENQTNALTLSKVAGIFYILAAGLVIAMVVALFEFCYKSKTDAARTKLSLSDAMKAKAKMSLSGCKDLDNGRYFSHAHPRTQEGDSVNLHSNTHV